MVPTKRHIDLEQQYGYHPLDVSKQLADPYQFTKISHMVLLHNRKKGRKIFIKLRTKFFS